MTYGAPGIEPGRAEWGGRAHDVRGQAEDVPGGERALREPRDVDPRGLDRIGHDHLPQEADDPRVVTRRTQLLSDCSGLTTIKPALLPCRRILDPAFWLSAFIVAPWMSKISPQPPGVTRQSHWGGKILKVTESHARTRLLRAFSTAQHRRGSGRVGGGNDVAHEGV